MMKHYCPIEGTMSEIQISRSGSLLVQERKAHQVRIGDASLWDRLAVVFPLGLKDVCWLHNHDQ